MIISLSRQPGVLAMVQPRREPGSETPQNTVSPLLLYDAKHCAHRVRLGDAIPFKVLGEGGIWQGILTDVLGVKITLAADHYVSAGSQVIVSPSDVWGSGHINHALAQCVHASKSALDQPFILVFSILHFMN